MEMERNIEIGIKETSFHNITLSILIEQIGLAVTPWSCIRKVSGPNLGKDTGYPS